MRQARQNSKAAEAENLDRAAAEARSKKKKIGEPKGTRWRIGRDRHSPGHGAIGLDAVLEAIELPAGVADLDPGLADVDADDLSHLARPPPFLLPLLLSPRLLPLAGRSLSLSSFQNV